MEAVLLTLQILVTMLIGFVARKFGVVDSQFREKVAPFMIDVGMPCLILGTFAVMEFDKESFKSGLGLMGAALLVLLILYLLSLAFKRICKNKGMGAAGQVAILFPNYTFMGIPVARGLFGDEGLFYFMMLIMPIEALYYILIPLILAPKGKGKVKLDLKGIVKLFLTPAMVAIVVAITLYVCRVKLPGFIINTLSNMTTLVSTMGIVLVGISVADIELKNMFSRLENILLPIFIDVLAPVAILIVFKIAFSGVFPPICLAVAVTFAAMPGGTLTALWAARYYDADVINFAAVGVMLSTVLSIGTIPLISMLINMFLY